MILINSSTRQFNIPGADLVFGVTGDAGSAVKEFSCPRYVGNNLDLTGCFIRMNYRNANGEVDSYLVPEVAVDGDNVVFGWELAPKVTMYKGNVSFVMCVTGPDTKVAWHTTLGRGQVLEGLEPDSAMIEEGTADVVAALIAMVEAQTEAVENKGAEWVRNVQLEGTDQISAVQSAARTAQTDAVAEIEAKGVNTRNSIPADYTALSEAVDALARTRGAAIVCSVEGSAITVNDASDMAIQDMKIFGRSTQDGTPTPDAPVEIKSVVEPVVTVCDKNIFNKSGDKELVVGTSGAKRWGYIFDLTGTYTFSCFAESVTSIAYKIVTDGVYGSFQTLTGEIAFTVTLAENQQLLIYKGVEGERFNYGIQNAQLEKGDVVTDYEPYSGRNIELTHTLPGIPVTSGGNYTDSDGQQWICDEVDLERGVYIKRVNSTDLGTLEWTYNPEYDVFLTYVQDIYPNTLNLISTHYQTSRLNSASSPDFTIYGRRSGNLGGLGVKNSNFKDAATFKSAMSGAMALYEITTPVETALSETEIAAYRALHSNYPNTTVLNDAGAHMVVKYAADTKLYIDNKITALIGG